MYKPRRITKAASFDQNAAAAFEAGPRRATRTRIDFLRTRVAPTAVSVAMLATAGGFALNLNGADQATSAVPAPARDVDSLSRDAMRGLSSTQEESASDDKSLDELALQASGPEVVPTEGDDAFVGAQWAAAFGAPAGSKFIQADTVVRVQASGDAASIGPVKEGDKISVTDKVEGKFRQVSVGGQLGWVLESRLGDQAPVKETPKPVATAAAKASSGSSGSSGSSSAAPAPAYSGKSVLGLKPKAMVVYNAVTERWSFSSIGGYRASNNRSNHGQGGAIDFMTFKDSAKGWAVANYLAANASAFGIDHIIFEQKIWTPYKPHWRAMADRGSITANHYDHVHVSVKL